MKITKSRLRQIIKEELARIDLEKKVDAPAPGATHERTPDEEEKLRRFLDSVTASIESEKEKKSIIRKIMAYLDAQKAQIKKDLMLPEQEENNPWAICTAQVGREDKEKYEKCVKSVKRKNKK